MLRKLALVGWACFVSAAVVLTAADRAPQMAQVSKTERVDFPAGGTLRIDKSYGELTVEGWDRPEVEVTTVKKMRPEDLGRAARQSSAPGSSAGAAAAQASSKAFERVQVALDRTGDEIVIGTAVPKIPGWERTFRRATAVELEYRIKAPRGARLTIDQRAGEIHIDQMTGEIHVTDGEGQITVNLPVDGHYAIDAKTRLGAIDCDFPGQETPKLKLGHMFLSESSSAGQKLFLRVGLGDITILNSSVGATLPAAIQK